MSRRFFQLIGGCLIGYSLLFGYKWFGKLMMNRHFNAMGKQIVTVTTAIVKEYNWPVTVAAIGTVQAINNVEITTEAPGMVETIRFESGDNIEKGSVLVELNAKTDLAQLDALQAEYKLSTQDFNRARQLLETNSISEAELDRKRSIVDQTLAQVIVQQELIKQKKICAPFSGYLGIRKINIGEYLSPGKAIVSLQSLDPIYVNFSIPEQDLYKIKIGLQASIRTAAVRNEVFYGQVTAIEPRAEVITRNFNIQATFNNSAFKMRPGMFAEITITLPNIRKSIAIPRQAVSYNPYGNSVYVVQTDREHKTLIVKRRFVKLSDNKDDMVAVLEGLVAGDEIVTSGLLKLRNNTEIQINNSISRVK